MELEVDVWLEIYLKICYKGYIPFVCERKEKFLIFSINSIFIRDFSLIEIYEIYDFSLIEIYEVLCVDKGIWMSEKNYRLNYIWS